MIIYQTFHTNSWKFSSEISVISSKFSQNISGLSSVLKESSELNRDQIFPKLAIVFRFGKQILYSFKMIFPLEESYSSSGCFCFQRPPSTIRDLNTATADASVINFGMFPCSSGVSIPRTANPESVIPQQFPWQSTARSNESIKNYLPSPFMRTSKKVHICASCGFSHGSCIFRAHFCHFSLFGETEILFFLGRCKVPFLLYSIIATYAIKVYWINGSRNNIIVILELVGGERNNIVLILELVRQPLWKCRFYSSIWFQGQSRLDL